VKERPPAGSLTTTRAERLPVALGWKRMIIRQLARPGTAEPAQESFRTANSVGLSFWTVRVPVGKSPWLLTVQVNSFAASAACPR